jgi:hypothetical protein
MSEYPTFSGACFVYLVPLAPSIASQSFLGRITVKPEVDVNWRNYKTISLKTPAMVFY